MSFDISPAMQTCAAGPPGSCSAMHVQPDLCEPSLDELLAEPIVRLVMKQDGVTELSIRRLVARLDTRRSRPELGVSP